MTLRDDFEQGVNPEMWPEVYGASTSTLCGMVVSGHALTFYKVSLTNLYSIVFCYVFYVKIVCKIILRFIIQRRALS